MSFFIHILLYENSITIRYLVTTIWVFEYYSEITYGPNTNSTIWSQLFEYRIIRIIRCNCIAEKELTNSVVLASDWLSNINALFGLTKKDSEKKITK